MDHSAVRELYTFQYYSPPNLLHPALESLFSHCSAKELCKMFIVISYFRSLFMERTFACQQKMRSFY